MATNDEGNPDYHCFICGVILQGTTNFLDQFPLDWRTTDWIFSVTMLTRKPAADKGGLYEKGQFNFRIIEIFYPNRGHGLAATYYPFDPLDYIRSIEALEDSEMGRFRSYESNSNKALISIIRRSGRASAFNEAGRERFWRMLRTLEDEEYGCMLDLTQYRSGLDGSDEEDNASQDVFQPNYRYGGAEHYAGWCGCWEMWYGEWERHSFENLPLGWKYFISPGSDFVERKWLRSNPADDRVRTNDGDGVVAQFPQDGRPPLPNQIQYPTRMNKVLQDALEWKESTSSGAGKEETQLNDLQILEETMRNCFLDERRLLVVQSEQTGEYPAQQTAAPNNELVRRLPQEIILQILHYLPTPVVIAALRGAAGTTQYSTCLIPSTLPITFWKTRFRPGFEMYSLFPEINDVFLNPRYPHCLSPIESLADFRTLYHYLGALSDLKSDIKYPLEDDEKILWDEYVTDPTDDVFPKEGDQVTDDIISFDRKVIRTASLSNRKRIHKCVQNLLLMFDRFQDPGDERGEEDLTVADKGSNESLVEDKDGVMAGTESD